MSRYFRKAVFRASMIAAIAVAVLGADGATPIRAQDETAAPTVALPMQRSNGERFVIEASQVKERINGETVVQSARQDSVAVATVESVGDDGYVLDIDTQTYEISGDQGFPDPLVERLVDMQIQMPVKLQMSPEGAVAGLANGPEVMAFAEQAMAEVGGFIESLDMPDEARPMLAQMMAQLSDPAYLEQSLLQTPRLYFFMSGAELELDSTYYIDDSIVFPLFTQPLPSQVFFGIREVDTETRTVTYDWWQEPDQEVFRQQLEEFILRFAEQAGAAPPSPDEIDFSSFTYTANAELVYDLDSGLPLSMIFVKTIAIQGTQNVETVEARTRFE